MSYATITLERAGGVATIRLNRAEKLNAINEQLHHDLQAVCADLRHDFDSRVVVLTGSGRAFSAGADLKGPRRTPAGNLLERRYDDAIGSRTCAAIEALDQISIAMVNGLAVGGGMGLAASCDLRVAAESAWFSIPEVDLGIPLTWNLLPRLNRLIGPARTIELVGGCDRFSATQALDWGFVNHVVPDASLPAFVHDFAARFVAKPALPLLYTKLAIRALNRTSELGEATYSDPDLLVLPRLYAAQAAAQAAAGEDGSATPG